MWENFVGRSHEFWQHFFVPARTAFSAALEGVSLEAFYGAINDVRPSFIRVEADEVTYNLHIMLRFELEQALISGDLVAADVPGAWNEVFERDFGLVPPDDSQGCLQDIHWSGGGIGYFPTYALGNMYAAQLFAAAGEELGDFPTGFAAGEFSVLRDWLRQNIHLRGRQFRAGRLVEVVTGDSLSHLALVKHLRERFDALYRLA
jgi:carboxypeptidase Taq